MELARAGTDNLNGGVSIKDIELAAENPPNKANSGDRGVGKGGGGHREPDESWP